MIPSSTIRIPHFPSLCSSVLSVVKSFWLLQMAEELRFWICEYHLGFGSQQTNQIEIFDDFLIFLPLGIRQFAFICFRTQFFQSSLCLFVRPVCDYLLRHFWSKNGSQELVEYGVS